MSKKLTGELIQHIDIKGYVVRVCHPFTEDFDPITGALINPDADRPIHYCIFVKIDKYDDGTYSALIIPGTSKKINFVEIGKLIVPPDTCVYSQTSLTKITKFIIRPSNMMILKLNSKYFPSYDEEKKSFKNKGVLSPEDIIKVNAYLNKPEIILLINNLRLLTNGEGTIPENEWADVKYIPIKPYLD